MFNFMLVMHTEFMKHELGSVSDLSLTRTCRSAGCVSPADAGHQVLPVPLLAGHLAQDEEAAGPPDAALRLGARHILHTALLPKL